CEIAQSETATQVRPLAHIWSNVAMVRMDGEKMSKSLGNMVFLRDLLLRYSADAIRVYLLGHHYRQEWEWSPAELDSAASLAQRLTLAAAEPDNADSHAVEAFRAALEDDLNTPQAIDVLTAVSGKPLRELGAVLGLTFAT